MELLKIKKKYSIKYVLTAKLFEVYIIFLLFCIGTVLISKPVYIIFFIILLIIIILATLILSKKSAINTYITFYEDKVVYKRKFLFINKEKVMQYKDIADIGYNYGNTLITSWFQKLFHYGNIYIYPKKGNIMFNGISLEVVENIEQVTEEIKEKVGDKIVV